MNLVVGATGLLGGEISERLTAQGKPVRALVRKTSDAAKLDKLRALGVELVAGDLTDAASLRAACAGVTTVLSTATVIGSQQPGDSFASVDDAGQKALIDVARATGVGHFIFISISGNLNVPCPITDAKRVVERYLAAAGVPYTVLRCAAFMETWLGPATGFDHAQRTARVLGSGEQRHSYVSRGDVVEFAAACVDNPAARNRVIEIGGPDAVTQHEAVRIFEEAAGAPYSVQTIPVTALQAQYDAAEHPVQKSFTGIMLSLAHDDVIPMSDTAREFGVQLTSVRDYAKRSAPIVRQAAPGRPE